MGPPHIKHHQLISETLSCHSQMESVSIKWVSQPRQFFLKKSAETCGRVVSVGGVIQTSDHLDRGARQIFSPKTAGAG